VAFDPGRAGQPLAHGFRMEAGPLWNTGLGPPMELVVNAIFTTTTQPNESRRNKMILHTVVNIKKNIVIV